LPSMGIARCLWVLPRGVGFRLKARVVSRLACLSAIALLLTVPFAQAAQRSRPASDDQGQALGLTGRPERIVSLAPHATELLFAAGAGGRVVAVDPASDFPPEASQLPRIAAWPRPDLEALRAAAPDLVLVWGAGLRPELREAIARIAPVWVSEPSTLEAIPHTLRRLGQLAGDAQRAELEADQFAQRLASLRAGASHAGRVRVFYQAWARPLVTVSNRDLIGDAIRLCGGQNVFGHEGAAARQIDHEALRAARPQLVVLGDGSNPQAPGGEPLARWQSRWVGTPPAVVAIPPDLLQRPSPRVIDGVQRLCAAIRSVAEASERPPLRSAGLP